MGGGGGGCFLVLRKPLLVCFCVVLWVLFSVFSILLHLVIAPVRNNKKLPMGDSSAADMIRRRDTHAHDDYRYPWGRVLGALIFNSTWKLPGVTR